MLYSDKEKADCPKLLFLHGILQSPLVDALVDVFGFCWIKLLSGGGSHTMKDFIYK